MSSCLYAVWFLASESNAIISLNRRICFRGTRWQGSSQLNPTHSMPENKRTSQLCFSRDTAALLSPASSANAELKLLSRKHICGDGDLGWDLSKVKFLSDCFLTWHMSMRREIAFARRVGCSYSKITVPTQEAVLKRNISFSLNDCQPMRIPVVTKLKRLAMAAKLGALSAAMNLLQRSSLFWIALM